MSDQFELSAELRNDLGKGASRRLRRSADLVPAIIYGGKKDPQPLSLIRKDLEKALENEAFFSHVLTIDVAGEKQKAVIKDLQRHPAREDVMHADFMRVDDKVAIKMHVPIHFLNEESCKGVKLEGGVIQHMETDVEVLCLPNDIPEYIEVDMAELEIGDNVHLSEIKLPEGVTSVALSLGDEHDLTIASVMAPTVPTEDEDEEAGEGEEAADDTADSEGGDEEEENGED